jgi:hypothetical protein
MPWSVPSKFTNLKIGRPSTPSKPSSGISRAQNFSTTKLQQQKDRDAARVSASQAMRARRGGGGQATTSINRLGRSSGAVSSVSHVNDAKQIDDNNSMYYADADERRSDHVRNLIRARKAKAKKKKESYYKGFIKKSGHKTGDKLGYKDRVKMKLNLEQARQRGSISHDDAKDFKSRVDKI